MKIALEEQDCLACKPQNISSVVQLYGLHVVLTHQARTPPHVQLLGLRVLARTAARDLG